MRLHRAPPALLGLALLAGCQQDRAANDAEAPDVGAMAPVPHPSVDAAVKKPVTDLSDPSWYACTSDADCTSVQAGTSCGWFAVRSDKANEYAQVEGSRHANQGAGQGCMHPKPRPAAACANGTCATVDAPAPDASSPAARK